MLKHIGMGMGLAGVMLGLLFWFKSTRPEEAGHFVQNIYGQRISWKTNLPIPLYIHNDFPREHIPVVMSAMHIWEKAAGRPLFKIVGTHFRKNQSPTKDGLSVIYWMKTWDVSKPSEQARTSIHWTGREINEADLKINAHNFSYYVKSTQSDAAGVHLESLLVHELGHVLGLKHNDSGGSVMATYLSLRTVRETLSIEDREALNLEYL